MSTTFGATPPFSIIAPTRSGARLHQSSSWWAVLPSPVIRLWSTRRVQRKALGDLAEQSHLLADIGLTCAQALHEAAKPFWRR